MAENSNIAVVIDDMMATRALVAQLLGAQGIHDVRQAESGADGLRIIHDILSSGDCPFVIFLDWHMPNGLSGVEVLTELKADPKTKNVPVIMISAREQSTNILECMEKGAADYIIKPITAEILAQKLSRILKR